jgi:hypothetical protein
MAGVRGALLMGGLLVWTARCRAFRQWWLSPVAAAAVTARQEEFVARARARAAKSAAGRVAPQALLASIRRYPERSAAAKARDYGVHGSQYIRGQENVDEEIAGAVALDLAFSRNPVHDRLRTLPPCY